MAYEVEFANAVKGRLKSLKAHQRARVLNEIEKQLVREPLTETRNRKHLRLLSSTSPEFMEIIEQSRRELQLGRNLSLDETKREVAAMN